MKVTIDDIAQQAGVSKATVSRVLNDRPEGVGSATRTRIQELLRTTGFQPSGVARGLATGRSKTVGLIISDIANPFYSLVVRGVEDRLNEAGYSLFLCNSDRNVAKEKNYLRILGENGVEGIILDVADSQGEDQLESLEGRGIPFVLLDRQLEGRTTRAGVFVDNRQGAQLAAEFLLSGPDCSLLFLNGPSHLSQAQLRLAGVADVWKSQGREPGDLRVIPGDDTIESGYSLIRKRLAGGPDFNALFAANDLMAIGAIRALKEAKVAVPAEVEVMGFDDIEMANLVDPPLSTVSQPARAMGARSADLLLAMLSGKPTRPQVVTLKPQLVLRGTTRTRNP